MASEFGNFFKGHFLTAMPTLKDPNFHRTVTCLCEHNANGAFGVVINRAYAAMGGADIFKELDIDFKPELADLPIYIGGPVHIDQVFILHGPPLAWEGSLMVTPELALSNTIDLLKAIATGTGPESFMILLGGAGWAPGQLEAELRENAWLTSPLALETIFSVPVDQRWEVSMKTMGINPALLSEQAGHA